MAILFAAPLLAMAGPADAPTPLRRLEVQLDGRPNAEPIDAVQADYQVLLPLAALSRLLGLDIRVDAALGRAVGTLPASGGPFSLDLTEASVGVGKRRMSFEPRLAQAIGGDIYVSTQLLVRWLKLELAVDLPHGQVRLRPSSDAATARSAPTPPTGPRRINENQLLVLEVELDGQVVSDSFTAYQDGTQTLLPLGELSRLLMLAIQVRPDEGSANGLLPRSRDFALNLGESLVSVGGREQRFEPRLAAVAGDDIFVSRHLLMRWLPLDLQVDLARLKLKIVPREKLPLQERQERERLAAALAGMQTADRPRYPYAASTPGLIDVPSIDQSFGADARFGRHSRQYKTAYTAYLTSDLLGMEGSAYVLMTQDKARPDLRVTLARNDPDAGLLGPLRARSVALGNIALPSVRNLMQGSARGNGAMVSNRPLDQPNSFDRHSLRGDLPPGWDVTLYYNDQLLAYQSSRADGQYAFDDLPLSFGPNEFRLVFHGPLGQLRVEKQSFLLDQASLKPGDVVYTLAAQVADDGSVRGVAQADIGLGNKLTGKLGLVRRPRLVNGLAAEPLDYAQLGLLAYLDTLILSGQLVTMRSGGALGEVGLKTRLGAFALDLLHTRRQGGFASDPFADVAGGARQRDELRLRGGVRLGPLPHLMLDFSALRQTLDGAPSQVQLSLRTSLMVRGTALSNSLRWQLNGDFTGMDGALQLSRRVADTGLNAQVNYRLQPGASVQAVTISADRNLAKGYQLSAGLLRSMDSGLTLLSAGFSKNLGSFGLALSASYSSQRELALGLQLFVALDRDPRNGRWQLDGQPLAGSGAVSARAFVDRNMNGVYEAGEEVVPNAGFVLNGGGRHPRHTGADGVALLSRLAPGRYADIALDPTTLEDPQWKPLVPGVRVLPRPGRVEPLEFPVIMTSEVEGTVYLLETGGKRRGIGDARLELVDGSGRVIATTTSAADGYYLFHQVTPGPLRLRVAPEQAAKLKLQGALERAVEVPANGDFLSGEDLELRLGP
ncbi:MAG: MSCRAMM family protein [Roseateles sp.]|uniref:MSCRAMM family protein n=1 Tax=Roseateles sp. TaxID=1971397 RepID=UPI004036703F